MQVYRQHQIPSAGSHRVSLHEGPLRTGPRGMEMCPVRDISYSTVLVCLPLLWETPWRKQLGKKRIIAFIGCSPSLRKAKTELKAKVTDEHCMLAPSQILVLMQHESDYLGDNATYGGLVPSTSTSNQEDVPQASSKLAWPVSTGVAVSFYISHSFTACFRDLDYWSQEQDLSGVFGLG